MKNKATEIVSIMVYNRIKTEHQKEYEDWQKRINKELEKHNGFIGISSKQLSETKGEYFTIFQFDSQENLNKWQATDTLKIYLDELKNYTEIDSKVSQHEGLEIFFGEKEEDGMNTPFYKKVILGVIAVYPLIILIDRLYYWLVPGAENIPFELGLFFQVIVISTLMTYPMMPLLGKLLKKWLSH